MLGRQFKHAWRQHNRKDCSTIAITAFWQIDLGGLPMSREFKQWFLVALEISIVILTLAVAGLALRDPLITRTMIGNASDGVAKGVLFGVIKTITRVNSSRLARAPVRSWWCFTGSVLKKEALSGFLGGWLFGLLSGIVPFAIG
jgi:hypothetical protein